jgi:hypothetical protein
MIQAGAMITLAEAREQLAFHCGTDPRVDDPRWKIGFLSTLRPYAGLRKDVLDDVDRCVDAVAEHLCNADSLDREIINSLWGIVHFGRAWALDDDGMLKRNRLITDEDAAYLANWLNELSFRVAMLLDRSADYEGPGNTPRFS